MTICLYVVNDVGYIFVLIDDVCGTWPKQFCHDFDKE